MPFSAFLDGKRTVCKELVAELKKTFSYVSILGVDTGETVYFADKALSSVSESESDRGFVIKMYNGRSFFEYSLDDINGDIAELASKIVSEVKIDPSLESRMISAGAIADIPMKKDFLRENDFGSYEDDYLLDFCKKTSKKTVEADEKVLNGFAVIMTYTVSKLFITENRELSQCYGWANGAVMAVYSDGKMAQARRVAASDKLADIIAKMSDDQKGLIDLARHLANAKQIKPGVYDVITDSSITGLIAHEAFGHGVEMDQFVKDRALAKNCVGEYVASPISSMHDGAAATLSVASYFFDDDGVLAQDTEIIKDGILMRGLSDLTSATELGTTPTGNGRRDSHKRKAYARMTNTFFLPGNDKLEDMIASVKHGYMLFETNNGMEDPKNWQIQCTAEYGIEIVDGKLTDNYVSPVVMSGYVPDLLKSISMVSDSFEVIGAGFCGKGYKEWVRVSDGGPNLKVRVKLG
ncbi:MAG: TldD/PmbA family protein [Clostridia bacterium]|nr:TldD/PmbA family protein [Clostridia bacterium]